MTNHLLASQIFIQANSKRTIVVLFFGYYCKIIKCNCKKNSVYTWFEPFADKTKKSMTILQAI